MAEEKVKLISHGFGSWVSFLQATVSLSAVIGTIVVTAILYFLDDRYASADVIDKIGVNSTTALRVESKVDKIELRLVTADYRDAWQSYCRTQPGSTARSAYKARLDDLEDDLKELTRKLNPRPSLPRLLPCEDLL